MCVLSIGSTGDCSDYRKQEWRPLTDPVEIILVLHRHHWKGRKTQLEEAWVRMRFQCRLTIDRERWPDTW